MSCDSFHHPIATPNLLFSDLAENIPSLNSARNGPAVQDTASTNIPRAIRFMQPPHQSHRTSVSSSFVSGDRDRSPWPTCLGYLIYPSQLANYLGRSFSVSIYQSSPQTPGRYGLGLEGA